MSDLEQFPLLTSSQNPKIKQAIRLRERRERNKTDLFLIEGLRELQRCCASDRRLETLFICPELFQENQEEQILLQRKDVQIYRCDEQLFRKISYRERPDGLLAIAPQMHLELSDLDETSFLVVAESIEKPGNLGTILRSSDAAGVDGVIICDRCTDLHNPNVVRASMGTLFTQPVVEAGGKETLDWLKKNGVQILAATPHAEKVYTEVDLTQPVAIAVGTEDVGLSEMWMQESDLQVRIPMLGIADSLNVATATTLLLYELLRQRNISGI